MKAPAPAALQHRACSVVSFGRPSGAALDSTTASRATLLTTGDFTRSPSLTPSIAVNSWILVGIESVMAEVSWQRRAEKLECDEGSSSPLTPRY
eukprot:CAMPEP_0183381260 /NCGR_PEP_ID=MMETSP0164_2-20130417/126349_1 /TAXON_ID=221442 /ORGANISM="Coccolithus pelagicus ssp braarudi, Strain PLY182g" /LENGTH=93 /DNA_ID=CAMNT_0025558867 /DNA_START=975 /DNA_END=1256 /DNA_ORIENTATION=+